ncbi:MAG: hypothetical protein OEZ39_02290 [Gammaproteobacteria bacterium]|nr:hypothetical protein [Gammaproteobacteria bacterium]MDH5650684.1 hypothetical protein [Gammaproteobacteria bacterium]
MTAYIQAGNATNEWHKLVTEAQQAAGTQLDEDLESYLVFLLMRYTERPEMAAGILALDYLHGAESTGKLRRDRMQDVGDQCLLYSGLFPERAERRLVRISYYVDLGRSAYHTAAAAGQQALSQLFATLATQFVLLMDTLQAMRGINGDPQQLSPILAFELWEDTGSRQAQQTLRGITNGVLIKNSRSKREH